MLDYTVVLDLIQIYTYIRTPQILLLVEAITAIIASSLIFWLIRNSRSQKNKGSITTPLLFSIAYIFIIMGALFLYELTNIHSDNIIIFCIYFIIMTIGEALLSPEGTTLSGRLIHPNNQLYAVSLWGSVPGVGYFFQALLQATSFITIPLRREI